MQRSGAHHIKVELLALLTEPEQPVRLNGRKTRILFTCLSPVPHGWHSSRSWRIMMKKAFIFLLASQMIQICPTCFSIQKSKSIPFDFSLAFLDRAIALHPPHCLWDSRSAADASPRKSDCFDSTDEGEPCNELPQDRDILKTSRNSSVQDIARKKRLLSRTMHCSHVQHTSPTERIFIAFASYGDVFQTHWEDDIGPSTTMGYPRLSFYTKAVLQATIHLGNTKKAKHWRLKKKSDMIAWMSLHNAHAIRVKEWCFLSPKDRLRLRLPWFRRMTPLDVHLYNLPTAEKAKSEKTGQSPKNPPFPSLSKTNFLNFSTSNVMSEIFRMRVHHIISYCTAQDTFFTTLSVEHGWTSSSANTFLLLQMWHLLAIDQIDPLRHLLHAPQPPWVKCTNSIQHIDFTV